MNSKQNRLKIVRTSTIPLSLKVLLKGQLQFLNQNFHVIAVSGNNKDLQTVKEREEVEVYPIEMERSISLFKDIKSLWNMYFFLKKEKPDLVHSITPKAGLITMLAAKMAGIPLRLHTFTGLIFPTKTGLFQKLLIKMDQLLCWSATNVYPEGQGVKNDLIKYKITNKPLKVIANGNINGVDLDYFNVNNISEKQKEVLKSKLGINSSDFVYLFVGRIVKDKGITELISAFKKMDTKDKKLILVGSFEQDQDPLEKKIFDIIQSHPNIICVGWQDDVRPYFAISHTLVFPSYREGFPNVVLQAGAMGLPSIVSNINGCNEIIRHKENGLIVPVRNIEDLYSKMVYIFNKKELYNSLKANSNKNIKNYFDQKFVWSKISEEYHYLLSLKN